MRLDYYSCDGQITITDYLKSKIKSGEVKDLTNFINSQGKAQYTQIGEVIHNSYERYKNDEDMLYRMTNAMSVYVLEQSMKYMDYLRKKQNCRWLYEQV